MHKGKRDQSRPKNILNLDLNSARSNTSIASDTLQYVIDSLFQSGDHTNTSRGDYDDYKLNHSANLTYDSLPEEHDVDDRSTASLSIMSDDPRYLKQKLRSLGDRLSTAMSKKKSKRRSDESTQPTSESDTDVKIKNEEARPRSRNRSYSLGGKTLVDLPTVSAYRKSNNSSKHDDTKEYDDASSIAHSEDEESTIEYTTIAENKTEKELKKTKEQVKALKKIIAKQEEERSDATRELKLKEIEKLKKTREENDKKKVIETFELENQARIASLQNELQQIKSAFAGQLEKSDIATKEKDLELKALREIYEAKSKEFQEKEKKLNQHVFSISEQMRDSAERSKVLATENQNLNTQIQHKVEELNQYEKLLKDLKKREQEWQEKEKQFMSIEKKYIDIANQLKEIKKYTQSLENENASLKHKNEENENTYKAAFQQLSTSLDETRKRAEAFESKANELTGQNQQMQNDINSKNETINMYQNQIAQTQQSYSSTLEELDQLKKQKERQIEELGEVFKTKLEEMFKREKSTKEKLRESQHKIQELESHINTIQSENNEKISQYMNQSNKDASTRAKLEEDLSKVRAKLDSEIKNKLHLGSRIKLLENEYEKLVKAVNEERENKTKLLSENSELESQIIVYKEMYETVSGNDAKSAQFAILRKKIFELDRESKQASAKIQEIFTKVQQSDLQLSSINQDLASIRDIHREMFNHNDELMSKLKQLLQIDKEDEWKDLDRRNTEYLDEHNSLQDEHFSHLISQQKRFDHEIKSHKDKITELMKDINSQNKELSEIKTAFSLFKHKYIEPDNDMDSSHAEDADEIGSDYERGKSKSPRRKSFGKKVTLNTSKPKAPTPTLPAKQKKNTKIMPESIMNDLKQLQKQRAALLKRQKELSYFR